MKYFSCIFGLVTKHDPTTENGGLFFAHYLVLKKALGLKITAEDFIVFTTKMLKAKTSDGLYKRSEHHTVRTVSHDEISGMLVSSNILKTQHTEEIMSKLESGFGNYPATGVNKFYNPADFYAWATLAKRWYAPLFAPFYVLNLLITSNKKKQDTSGKLIYMDELFLMKDLSLLSKLLHKYFVWRMKKMYGQFWVKELFSIYFSTEDADFPLLELSQQIQGDI